MDRQPPRASRKPRSDSVRNRERLLAAARAVFAEGGAGASLEAVARRADLGIGTLYRHFPTRDALFQAVYRHEVDQLVALADALPRDAGPEEALRRWLHANVGMVATKKGMLAALAPSPDRSRDLFADSRTRLTAAAGRLMAAAQAAGAVRTDVGAGDLLGAFYGICYGQEGPDWQADATRLIDVFVDGLTRPGRG